jgi:hypothetical protein
MTFTKRESAESLYRAAIGTGMGQVRGADPDEVRTARVQTHRRAEQAIEAAIGSERVLLREPCDVTLRRWLEQVKQRRAALQPATT